MVHAEVGTGKEKMDMVHLDFVISVVESFGRFLNHSVSKVEYI